MKAAKQLTAVLTQLEEKALAMTTTEEKTRGAEAVMEKGDEERRAKEVEVKGADCWVEAEERAKEAEVKGADCWVEAEGRAEEAE
eukprot:110146-Pleurochrysis_carterae.AAC.1